VARKAIRDRRRDEDYVRRTARQFKAMYPWVDVRSVELSLALNACHIIQREAVAREMDALGLGRAFGRSGVLRTLYFNEGSALTHQEIAKELSVTPGTVTYIVNGLEKDSLVKRIPDGTDRRITYVVLTDQGRGVTSTLLPMIPQLSGELFEDFSTDEKDTLLRLLLRLLDRAWRREAELASGQQGGSSSSFAE
jgi:DNA-binding MarR family transcriptional regulator